MPKPNIKGSTAMGIKGYADTQPISFADTDVSSTATSHASQTVSNQTATSTNSQTSQSSQTISGKTTSSKSASNTRSVGVVAGGGQTSKKAGGFNKTKAKVFINNLNSELTKCEKAIIQLQKDMETLQKGDGTVAYWSGERAYAWVYSTIEYINKVDNLLGRMDETVDGLTFNVNSGKNI